MRKCVAHKSWVPTPKVYAQGQGHNQVRGQIVPKFVLLVNNSSKFDKNAQNDKT